MSGITPPPGGPAISGAASMLGPASSVMQNIFDAVEADQAGAEGEESEAAGAEAPAATPTADQLAGAADGDAGDAGAGAAGGAGAATEALSGPARPAVTPGDKAVVEQVGQLSDALDDRFTAYYQGQVVEQFNEEYGHYTDLLGLHPLELVGKEVPPLDGSDQNVVFSSPQEAREYQEAVKTILSRMMNTEVARLREEDQETLDVVHDSIALFQNNPDLIPGGPSYNKDLAATVMRLVEPYGLKMDGKLTGFSINIQGIVDQARGQLKAGAPAAPAKKAPAKKAAASAGRPQAGLATKAGASGESAEDFSPMWAALGINQMPV